MVSDSIVDNSQLGSAAVEKNEEDPRRKKKKSKKRPREDPDCEITPGSSEICADAPEDAKGTSSNILPKKHKKKKEKKIVEEPKEIPLQDPIGKTEDCPDQIVSGELNSSPNVPLERKKKKRKKVTVFNSLVPPSVAGRK